MSKKRAAPSFQFLRENLLKRTPKWGAGDDVNGIDLHPLQILEWQLLSLDDDEFKKFLQTQAPVVGGQKVVVTGDPVIDELERLAAEDLAQGGEGVPDGWKERE